MKKIKRSSEFALSLICITGSDKVINMVNLDDDTVFYGTTIELINECTTESYVIPKQFNLHNIDINDNECKIVIDEI